MTEQQTIYHPYMWDRGIDLSKADAEEACRRWPDSFRSDRPWTTEEADARFEARRANRPPDDAVAEAFIEFIGVRMRHAYWTSIPTPAETFFNQL
ncbi:hypothetical protein ASE04_21130 [Rhizobium sp. Root708]|uniref:hypothetical protein n=1 Tax=Rhizobium sp. Root708 TaxID=1736592 RepID=UPI0006F70A10|nr:hypothetical protein [Rhizobium sp. Root708]KRB61376.1 hypothetical protein ASE04_21130 [Rhizobium sp. Root708]